MSEDLVYCQDLLFGYKKNQPILSNLSCTLHRGEIIGILGHNGAGKTTFLRLLGGILEPDSGCITTTMSRSERVGFMPEGLGLYPRLSGTDNARLILLKSHKNVTSITVNNVLDEIKLSEHAHKPVGYWSTGMKRRLSLMNALSDNPTMTLLDEPFLGIDPVSQKLMIDKIRKSMNQMSSIILTSHDLQVIKELCTRIIIFKNGNIVLDSSEINIIQDIQTIYFQYAGE